MQTTLCHLSIGAFQKYLHFPGVLSVFVSFFGKQMSLNHQLISSYQLLHVHLDGRSKQASLQEGVSFSYLRLRYRSHLHYNPVNQHAWVVLTSVSRQFYWPSLSSVLCASSSVGLVMDLVAGGEDRLQVMDEGNLGLSGTSPPFTRIQPSKN